MRALLVLVLVIFFAAASALAYGQADVTSMVARPGWVTEPAALLLSGSALLAVGGILRRLPW